MGMSRLNYWVKSAAWWREGCEEWLKFAVTSGDPQRAMVQAERDAECYISALNEVRMTVLWDDLMRSAIAKGG